jgi:hypothetical protein
MKSTAGGGTTPVGKNWAADLRVYTNGMRGRSALNGNTTGFNGETRPKAETTWSLKQALDAVNDQIQEIEASRPPGAWAELSTSKMMEKTKLMLRKGELKKKLSGLE